MLLQSTMGWTRVRFLASVKAGARVRLRVTLWSSSSRGRRHEDLDEPPLIAGVHHIREGSLRRVAAEGAGHRWARRKDILSRVVVSRDHEPTKVWCRVAADRRIRDAHQVHFTTRRAWQRSRSSI